MRNKKQIYKLAIIFLVLLVIVILLNTEIFNRSSTYKLEEQFFKIDSALVDKLILEQKGKRVVLEKTYEWRVTEPVNYKANDININFAISDLKNYRIISLQADNLNRKEKFGFTDTSEVKVTVFQKGEEMGSFIIGGQGPGHPQVYVRKVDGNEIYLADGILHYNFVKNSSNDWRDLSIIKIPKGSIKSLEFISKEGSFVLEKDTTASTFKHGNDSINTSILEGVLNMLNDFNTQSFKDSTLGPDVKFDFTLRVVWDKVTNINFLKYGDEESPRYIIKVDGIEQLFDVDKNFALNLMKTKKDLIVSKSK